MCAIYWLHQWNAKDRDAVMPIYNLIEWSNNYSKPSGSLWQYYRDEPNDNKFKSWIIPI